MNPSKRTHSPAESERCTKTAKISHETDNTGAGENQLDLYSEAKTIQVTVKLRSTTKAARNNPIPPGYLNKLAASTSSGSNDAGDRPSPSSENGGVTGCHTQPPTPPQPSQPSSSTATGRQKRPSPVDGSSPHEDGTATGSAKERSSDAPSVHDAKQEDRRQGDDNVASEQQDDDGEDFDDAVSDELDSYMYEDFSDAELSSDDEFAPFGWLEQIDGAAQVGETRIADCDAKLIRRASMRRNFWDEMEAPSEETSDLAFELFDRYGYLRREYYEDEIDRGTGAWGHELDHGDLLLFESLHVERSWRHRGVGTKIVKAVLERARSMSVRFFAFAQPGCLTRDLVGKNMNSREYAEAADELAAISQHFWRSLGFRRVGTSGWLAFTDNSHHPSRLLSVEEDWDMPKRPERENPLPEPVQALFQSLSDPSVPDAECVRQVQEAFPGEEDAAAAQSYTDRSGDTILHIAAMGRKAEAVSYIRTKYPHLTGLRNDYGRTPLDALQSSLEEHRTMGPGDAGSDRFEGFTQLDISSLAALTDTEIFDLAKLSDQDISAISSAEDDAVRRRPEISTVRHTLRLKYGCTCGECIGGFLSPRMHLALLCQAEDQHALLSKNVGRSGPGWVAKNMDKLGYLSPPVRENLKTNKSMRRGFANMCDHIARCLRKKQLPNEETVLRLLQVETSEWPPVTRNYLQRGGTVAAVATMLFERAMCFDERAGNGMHAMDHKDDIKELPVCRNDHEFGFVSGTCGYKRVSAVRFVDLFGRERQF